MDLIDNPWMRECVIALVLFLQVGAAFALAAHEPAPAPEATGERSGAPGAVGDEADPAVTGTLPHRCEVFAPRAARPLASSMRSFEQACRKLDRLPITDADAEAIYQQMLVQAGGDAAQ